ncbi:hypothetical protein HZC33_00070 [Candidatus Wolfebacteria bacterium]|nr:hypothetical protein [Candidatus Wolfebacteria bacterium]
MILSSHIVAASALSAPLINQPFSFLNSALVFIISFLSHFLIDMIPHWDYKTAFGEKIKKADEFVDSKELKNLFQSDLVKFFFDGILGIVLSLAIFNFSDFLIDFNFEKIFMFSLIILGGILPDALNAFYFFRKKYLNEKSFLEYFHRFHNSVHGKSIFNGKFFLGAFSQILTIVEIIFLIKLFQQ